jgi:hypothetical protein
MRTSARAPRAWRVRDLGHLSNAADWVDRHIGDGRGLLDEHTLVRYADQYGTDPRHRETIKALALGLGFITVEAGGRVMIPRAGGTQVNAGGNGANYSIDVGGGVTMQIGITIGPFEQRVESLGPQRLTSTAVRSTASAAIARRLVAASGTANETDVALVIQELTKIPRPLLEKLERENVTVRVCRGAVTEHKWNLSGQHPRGHPPGATWDNVDGCYTWGSREITVATLSDGYGRRTLRANTVLHEVGHALDEIGGNLSRGRKFRMAYSLDTSTLQRNGQNYLLQSGDAGAEEACAESFAWFINHRNWIGSNYYGMAQFWEDAESAGWR